MIAALETYLGRRFDEKLDFTAFVSGWVVKHYANCCGLAILEKLPGDVLTANGGSERSSSLEFAFGGVDGARGRKVGASGNISPGAINESVGDVR